ncbi:ABC transporter ATP-binding protein [Hydrogenophaga sp.]|uniref:ABC transporter ATP-binding protein n=1 Tax=Hydrogenophaga sp. TaxID=1904254 RepID=UPI0025C03032|nr:ABC transporter ATP-binding protein [Hydrogenophaga sp.]MBT9465658.1 ABC transporter ATP-binding protein [Hydrogenophaga sp.]
MHALQLDTYQLTKRFGAFTALDGVSLTVRPGTVHALLGENGAGKSTFVKAVVGYHRGDEGAVLIDGREQDIHSPSVARELGIGMVYQHFTVVPGMTVAENLLLARGALPAVIDWKAARAELKAFMASAPFSLELDAYPIDLSAGQKQKLEILKQMLLRPRLLILDEPTSVLTPQEADEVLGALKERAHAGDCSIVMITHKFREVTAYADDVSVLRRGQLVLSKAVAQTDPDELAHAMVGQAAEKALLEKTAQPFDAEVTLAVDGLTVMGDRGDLALNGLTLQVRAGEILGIAGVSGNGQKELMQALTGQRARLGGDVTVRGEPYAGRREQNRVLEVRSLPEEPLINACVPDMSVSENMALRLFDEAPLAQAGFVRWPRLRAMAQRWVDEYRVKTPGIDAPIRALSGGNVQRAVLARELAGVAKLLLVSNPTFGLDFAATAEIHARLVAARNRGAAVLLISEDLDELMQLADRVAVISGGQLVFETPSDGADRKLLGAHMAGGHGEEAAQSEPQAEEVSA